MTGERKTKLAYLAAGFGLALGLQALGQSVKDGTRYVSSGGTELRMLLNLRYRIRNDLGLPEDGYDHLID